MQAADSKSPHTSWTLFTRFTLRHWRQSLGSYLLLLAIVAVGVGAFNGIRQASRAASANFGLFNEAVSGQSDFVIQKASGTLSENDLIKLQSLSGYPAWHLLPVIEGSLTQIDPDTNAQRQLRLIGLDLIAIGNLPRFVEQGLQVVDQDAQWFDYIGRPDLIWISYKLQELANFQVGDRIQLATGGRMQSAQIAGILGDAENPLPEDLVIADIPVAQTILSRPAGIDRLEIVLQDRIRRADTEYLESIQNRIEALLPEGFLLKPAAERAAQRASMTEAFRLNLMILSLIAILVGAYLILQALDAAVVRRRQEMATLKSLGVSSKILFRISMMEAAFIGVLGSFAGIGVGYLLALAAVHSIEDTVNALYFASSSQAIELTASDWWIGLSLGTIFSLLAGWIPARDAMETPPAQILSRGDWSPGFAWLSKPTVGIVLLAAGTLALAIPPIAMEGGSKFALGGFLAAAGFLLGVALLSGQILVGMAKLFSFLATGPVRRIALSRLADGSSRHRLAVAGLVIAIAMVTGMFQMVGSFRSTIIDWFDVRFQAELYISERGVSGVGDNNGLDPAIIDSLAADPAVSFMDTLYVERVKAPVGVTILAGIDLNAWKNQIDQLWLKPPGSLTAIEGAEPALISETFARRFDVLNGGTVRIETSTGPQTISPIGIFSDYGNEFGSAAIDQSVWKRWTLNDRPLNTSVYLTPESDTNVERDRLRVEYPGLDIRNAKELRDLAIGIFEQTFRVTAALNGIGIAVAMAGLLLGLIAIFEESSLTWKTLDYLGFTRRRLVLAAGLEGAGIAFAAWISGTGIGLILGWILITKINVQSFGWTLQWHLPVFTFLTLGCFLVLAGGLCGIFSGAYWHRSHRKS